MLVLARSAREPNPADVMTISKAPRRLGMSAPTPRLRDHYVKFRAHINDYPDARRAARESFGA
jgi:hypothetical protein